MPDKYMPSWLRESRNTMKQTGKALLAWDEWGKNPARAAGGVTFNVLTTVFTGGEGAAVAGAGKAGAVAKAISVAGKVGRVIDPMTYVMKGAGAGLSKIGDIGKALKGAGKIDIPKIPDNAITLPEGTVHLPDGTVHLPEGADIPKGGVELPNGDVKLPDNAPLHPAGTEPLHTPEGEPALFADEHGNIVDHHGNTLMHREGGSQDIAKQSPDGSDVLHTGSPAKEPALVGAVPHVGDDSGHMGESAAGGTATSADNLITDGAHSAHASHASTNVVHDAVGGGGHSGHGVPDTSHSSSDAAHGSHPGGEPSHHPEPDGAPGHDHTENVSDGMIHDGTAAHEGGSPTMSGDDPIHMANGRDYEAKWGTDSTVPAPPKVPGDIVLETGDHVYFREGSTAVGYDDSTLTNFEKVKPLEGYHDVVVHGNNRGHFVPGRVNHSDVSFPAGETHPTHIAEAIRNNPGYDGGPVRLISCHSGTVAEGSLDVPAAQALANELGVPVMAPTNKVGVSRLRGPGQTPKIFDNGYWRTFFPISH
ncbi:hypothetical protein [Streptomyces sp. NPDC001680]